MKNCAFFLLILFFSCEEQEDTSLEELYLSLPSTEYVSQEYAVNGAYLTEKTSFNPPNPRTTEHLPIVLEYKNQEISTINHTASNSLLIVFAADTKVGDLCSVFESQGGKNQQFFIDGKLVIFPGHAVTGFKIKDNFLILQLHDPGGREKYELISK